jgi:hypothetical protein
MIVLSIVFRARERGYVIPQNTKQKTAERTLKIAITQTKTPYMSKAHSSAALDGNMHTRIHERLVTRAKLVGHKIDIFAVGA